MVDFAGIYTGKKVDKFEKCGFTRVESEKVSAPTIAECPLAIECKVFEVVPMGSHDVFMADIVSVSCKEEIMNKDGRLMLDRAGLLAYAHGEYFSLGEKLGKFGFSTDKAGKKKPEPKAKNKTADPAKIKEKSGACDATDAEAKNRVSESANARTKSGAVGSAEITAKGKATGALLKKENPGTNTAEAEKTPFYKAFEGGRKKKQGGAKDKGRPHGKRIKAKGEKER
jgi:hypothetical protein